jgi:hypothetical protein
VRSIIVTQASNKSAILGRSSIGERGKEQLLYAAVVHKGKLYQLRFIHHQSTSKAAGRIETLPRATGEQVLLSPIAYESSGNDVRQGGVTAVSKPNERRQRWF